MRIFNHVCSVQFGIDRQDRTNVICALLQRITRLGSLRLSALRILARSAQLAGIKPAGEPAYWGATAVEPVTGTTMPGSSLWRRPAHAFGQRAFAGTS
jgi:hypothetical protein